MKRFLQKGLRSLWFFGFVVVLLWAVWPLFRPFAFFGSGSSLLVVLDGYQRLDLALDRQRKSSESILLITCPATGQPTPRQKRRAKKMFVLKQGLDTVEQIKALAGWLEHLPASGHRMPGVVVLVSDAHHFPRAFIVAQLAVGGVGIKVAALKTSVGKEQPWTEASIWRDALRIQLWRLTGSTWGVLDSRATVRKFNSCYVHYR